MSDMADHAHSSSDQGSRRDFLYLTTASITAFGAAAAAWPLIDSMNPSQDVLALSSIEIDIGQIAIGQSITVKWRGKPVFIRHRTEEEIAKAVSEDTADMKDPQPDSARAKKPEWLVLVGVCTHLGCVPLGQKASDPKGEYGGWYCPCHGSQYDLSGRIRKGPAPINLEVPAYEFLSDTLVKIG
jgi:ubiquinol-cytochrome c reductase iron-sulfur subunit